MYVCKKLREFLKYKNGKATCYKKRKIICDSESYKPSQLKNRRQPKPNDDSGGNGGGIVEATLLGIWKFGGGSVVM